MKAILLLIIKFVGNSKYHRIKLTSTQKSPLKPWPCAQLVGASWRV